MKLSATVKKPQSGFTLIELIISIVIMSIISIGLTAFITDSADGYLNTSARNQVSSAGRMVIDRLSMEMHNALPNSIRITSAYTVISPEVIAGNASAGDQCIEFVPVSAASIYQNPPFRTANTTFDAIEFVPDQTAASNLFAIIYPHNTSKIYQNPIPTRGPRAAIQSISHDALLDTDIITLTASHRFNRRSRVQRLFITEEPISFCTKADRIYRYSNYGFNNTQLRPVNIGGACAASTCLPATTPNRVLLTTEVSNAGLTAFDQLEPSRRRNGVVQFELNFSKNGQSVTLNHETLLQASP